MNRFFKTLIVCAAALTAAVFASCRIVDAHAEKEESTVSKAVASLSVALAAAKDGEIIKVDRNTIIAKEVAVDKRVTISGSSCNVKGAAITINVSGVTLSGLENIGRVVIAEAVGEGDFTLTNCTAETVTVLGGGQNSGHFNGGVFGQILADYDLVRLVFGLIPRIGSLHVKKECRIETDAKNKNSKAQFGTIIVDNGVGKLHLTGKQSIEKLVTKSNNGKKPKVVTESKDIAIGKAGNIDEAGTTDTIDIESGNIDYDVPYFEEFTGTEAKEAEEKAEEVSLEDIKKAMNTDVPGCQQLIAEKYGILLKYEIASNVSQINIYRTDSAGNTYLTGICQTQSGLPLPELVNYTDYYVEKGETYKYYARYISSQNNNIVKTTETDTVTAAGGSGLRQYTSKPVLNLAGESCFGYTISGTPVIPMHQPPAGTVTNSANMYYFKKEGTSPKDTIVESTIYTVMSITDRSDNMPAQQQQLSIVDLSDIGSTLELYKIKNNYAIIKGDIKFTWVSIPQDGECGTGFTDNKIKLTYEQLPAYVTAAASGKGVDCVMDFSKISMLYADGNVYRVQIDNNRNFDRESITVRKNSSTEALSNEKITVTLPDETPGSNNIYKFNFRGGEGSAKYSYMTLNMYYKCTAGNGENKLDSGLLIEGYDKETGDSVLNALKNKLLQKPVAEAMKISIDGIDYEAVMTTEPHLIQSVTDAAYLDKTSFDYRWNEDAGKYLCNLTSGAGKSLYSYRTKVNCSYRAFDEEGNTVMQIDYTPVDTAFNRIKGLPEPLKIEVKPVDPAPGH